VTCDECGSRLEVVGLDPIEVDLHEEHESDDVADPDLAYDFEDDRY
jgi:hypothetical protein